MIGAQIIGLGFSLPVLLSVVVDGILPVLAWRPRRTPRLSGPEALILLEMAAALGWFFWNFHASHEARQMASFFPVLTAGQLQIAFRHRQSGAVPSYALPVITVLLTVGIILGMQSQPIDEGIGVAVLLAAVVWDMITINRIRRPANQSIT